MTIGSFQGARSALPAGRTSRVVERVQRSGKTKIARLNSEVGKFCLLARPSQGTKSPNRGGEEDLFKKSKALPIHFERVIH